MYVAVHFIAWSPTFLASFGGRAFLMNTSPALTAFFVHFSRYAHA
jgi:hypothetical protein